MQSLSTLQSYVGVLVGKLLDLGLSFSVCSWIKEFLTQRPQRGKTRLLLHYSQHRPPAGVPAEPSPVPSADPRLPTPSDNIMKFADDATIDGLISKEVCVQK